MSDEQEYLETIRVAAPKARQAARSAWRAALAWTWLAWRLTLRVWLWGAAEALGFGIAFLLMGAVGCSVLCIGAARGIAGWFADGWRWLWRRD
jgi:hypothetical protein